MVDQPAPDDREALAAELALGLLEGQERAEALRLCLSDPDFATEVEKWGLRLSPLLHGASEATPSERVWTAIEARIGGGHNPSLVHSLSFWRGAALVSGAIAASLGLLLLMRPPPPAMATTVAISQLTGPQGSSTIAIAYEPQRGILRLSRSSVGADGKAPELWVIPQDGVPRSLGLVAANGGDLPVDTKLRQFLRAGTTLAITLEDPATSPHGAPSAPPILTGKITII